jgi:sodium/potassium-transporting ATPase subunit alpha
VFFYVKKIGKSNKIVLIHYFIILLSLLPVFLTRLWILSGIIFQLQAEDLRAAIQMDEHLITLEELYKRFNTTLEGGLTDDQVKILQDNGNNLNRLTPPVEKPEWLKLLETQKGFFNLLLWAGAILCFIGYALQQSVDNLYLGIVLTFVVTVTGIFEYFQERNASDLMAKFKDMLPPAADVKRNGGAFQPLPSLQLCVGDIVQIKAGQQIPADIRVISASDDMKVEQSVSFSF